MNYLKYFPKTYYTHRNFFSENYPKNLIFSGHVVNT